MGKSKGRVAQVLKRQRRQSLHDCRDVDLVERKIVKLAAATGAYAAVTKWNKVRKASMEEQRDRRLRNTKLLLKSYRMLKVHSEKAVYEASQLEDDIDIVELMENVFDGNIRVESIKRSAEKTYLIIRHVDEMLRLYEIYCDTYDREENRRRYNALYAVYIAEHPVSVREYAESEDMEIRVVYRDINSAVEKLTALIFGIDGLDTSK